MTDGITEAEFRAGLGLRPVEVAEPGSVSVGRSTMSVEEAYKVILDISPRSGGRLEEAERVMASVSAATPPPRNARVFETKLPPAGDLLTRVQEDPGGGFKGINADHNRRLDTAFQFLKKLAESRMGMTADLAERHAQMTFLELQHVSSTAEADESVETFVRRLEQRVDAYQAMSPLVIERAR